MKCCTGQCQEGRECPASTEVTRVLVVRFALIAVVAALCAVAHVFA